MVVFVIVVLFCGGWGSLLLSCVGKCSVVSAALCCEVLCCAVVVFVSVVLFCGGWGSLLLFFVGQCGVCHCGAVL